MKKRPLMILLIAFALLATAKLAPTWAAGMYNTEESAILPENGNGNFGPEDSDSEGDLNRIPGSLAEYNNITSLSSLGVHTNSNNSDVSSLFILPINAPLENSKPIYSREDLDAIRNTWGGKYHLMADIDLGNEEWVPIGDQEHSYFNVFFDGQGHTISNLHITQGESTYIGLFNKIARSEIKNLGLVNTSIEITEKRGSHYIGGIVGESYDSSISNCFNIGSITYTYTNETVYNFVAVGGIAGYINGSTIKHSYNRAYINVLNGGGAIVGGLIGNSYLGNLIANCYNSGEITAETFGSEGTLKAGGIAGRSNSDIEQSFNTGNIVAKSKYDYHLPETSIGGLVGVLLSNAINCYNAGDITASFPSSKIEGYVGGIAGIGGVIERCYSKGNIKSTGDHRVFTGGIIGYSGSKPENCVVLSDKIEPLSEGPRNIIANLQLTSNATQQRNAALLNIAGNVTDDSSFRISLLEAETEPLYRTTLGWDFDAIWKMPENGGYPILQWQTHDSFIPTTPTPTPSPEDIVLTTPLTDVTLQINHKDVTLKWGTDLFSDPASMYSQNSHYLATLASALSSAAYSQSDITRALRNLGFTNVLFQNYSYIPIYIGEDRVAYNIAIQKVSIDGITRNLIAIVIRGTEQDQVGDWFSDANLGYSEQTGKPSKEHLGFGISTAEVEESLKSYLTGSGRLKDDNLYIVTGHSKGAAVANLIAMDLYDGALSIAQPENIYAYTFASPNVDREISKDSFHYNYIYNFINPEDIVPRVPLKHYGWNYDKYGQVITLPAKGLSRDFSDIYQEDYDLEYRSLTGKDKSYLYTWHLTLGLETSIGEALSPVERFARSSSYVNNMFSGSLKYYDNLSGGVDSLNPFDHIFNFLSNAKFAITDTADMVTEFGDSFFYLLGGVGKFLVALLSVGETNPDLSRAVYDVNSALSATGIYSLDRLAAFQLPEPEQVNSFLQPIGKVGGLLAGDSHDCFAYLAWMIALNKHNPGEFVSNQIYSASYVNHVVIACPVDIEVNLADGTYIGSVTGETLDCGINPSIGIYLVGETKHVWFNNDKLVEIDFTGTDDGTMTYTVENMDFLSGNKLENKVFSNVALSNGIKMSSILGNAVGVQEVQLFLENDNGERTAEILENGVIVPLAPVFLSSLTISAGTLIPEFDPAITRYVASVPYSTSSINITALANNKLTNVSGTGVKTLVVGTNDFTLNVTDANGQTQIYMITITRDSSSNSGNVIGDLVPAGNATTKEKLSVDGSKMIPQAETSLIIKNASNKDATPYIKLDDSYKGGYFSGKDLLAIKAANKSLLIEKLRFSLSLSSSLINELGLTEESIVSIVFDPISGTANSTISQLKAENASNSELLKNIFAIDVKVDETSVARLNNPLMVTADVPNLTLTQNSTLTGICFDNDLKTFKQLGGELSESGKTFQFFGYNTGYIGLIFSDRLTKLSFTIGSVDYQKNGEFLANDVAPFISEEARTLVPIRVIAEAFGAVVNWNDELKMVSITKDDKTLRIIIGTKLPDDYGTAVIVQGRTFVPLRYVSEYLGANVIWKAENRTILIYQ
ncbi:MAG: cadherin-like beta sandwich domain-containing protein [Clostridiales bacterium]|jgi:hypothetical protein|nr:cadherin-like beta sandwich domain-containing protein [Clostridiales bacterium]